MIDVAVGVVFNLRGEVLITQRSKGSTHSSLWEFPGGKLEVNETALNALKRELKEEVNISCKQTDPWFVHEYDYSKFCVRLHVFVVRGYEGHAECLEAQQDLKWIDPAQLTSYPFPAANQLIIERLALFIPSNNHL
jgi:mutator protein MutT